jgi:hypothetical protein
LLEDTERQQAIQPQALRNDFSAGKASGEALAADPVLFTAPKRAPVSPAP